MGKKQQTLGVVMYVTPLTVDITSDWSIVSPLLSIKLSQMSGSMTKTCINSCNVLGRGYGWGGGLVDGVWSIHGVYMQHIYIYGPKHIDIQLPILRG